MNIDDGRVLAVSGAMLARGEFHFDGTDAHEFLQPSGSMIAIPSRRGGLGTDFRLVGNAQRDADGLWSADAAVHSLVLQTTVPALDQLLEFPSFALSREGLPSDLVHFEFTAEHSSFARIALNMVYGEDRPREPLVGQARSLAMEVRRTAEGLKLAMEARVETAMRGTSAAAPFTVSVTAELSFATLALAGSSLWWRGGADRWATPAEDQSGPLARVLTLDRAGGTPYFHGTLDLGAGHPDYYRGPWVKAWVSEHSLRLASQRPLRRSMGFVEGDISGPNLVFENLGTTTWEGMLDGGDTAVLELTGAGIGHVQGVTGRDAGEFGPHIQPISAVRVRLARSEEGLRMSFDGKLGEVRQKPSQAVLGPEFHGDFLVPTAFLFSRGIFLRSQWAERQGRLGRS